jgi:SAM-dependent methyltransferase
MWHLIQRHSGKHVLEVGNVLSHYFPVDHDVVDKYERARKVINVDVVDFEPVKKYDLIVSISTLEHIGWDERPKDPGKPRRAIAHLRGCLADGGCLAVTFPLGWNAELDRALRGGRLGFDNYFALKRVTMDNQWRQVDVSAGLGARYDAPFPFGNVVIVAFAGPA